MDPSMALVGFLKRLEGRLDVLSPCQEPGVSLSSVRWAGVEFLGHGEGSELGREQVLEALAVFGLFSGVGPDEEVTQASVEGKEGLTRLLFRPLQLRLGLVDTGGVYKHLFMRCNQAIQRPSLGIEMCWTALAASSRRAALSFNLARELVQSLRAAVVKKLSLNVIQFSGVVSESLALSCSLAELLTTVGLDRKV